jgi:hypothetical protein
MRNIIARGDGLRARSAKWMKDNAIRLRSTELPEIEGMNDREADNWEPLLLIAKMIGDDVYQRALAAAGSHMADDASLGELLLAHIREAFDEAGDPPHLSTEDIVRSLVNRDDGPWPKWWSDKVAAGNFKSAGSSLAHRLKPFGVKSRKFREGNETRRGYRRADLEPIWRAYVREEPQRQPGNARNKGTPQEGGGEQTELDLGAVPSSRASDQGRSVVPSASAPTGTCERCRGDGLHWHWCSNAGEG